MVELIPGNDTTERAELAMFARELGELMRADDIDLEHPNTRSVTLAMYLIHRADDVSSPTRNQAHVLLMKLDPRGKLAHRPATLDAMRCAIGFANSIEKLLEADREDRRRWRAART